MSLIKVNKIQPLSGDTLEIVTFGDDGGTAIDLSGAYAEQVSFTGSNPYLPGTLTGSDGAPSPSKTPYLNRFAPQRSTTFSGSVTIFTTGSDCADPSAPAYLEADKTARFYPTYFNQLTIDGPQAGIALVSQTASYFTKDTIQMGLSFWSHANLGFNGTSDATISWDPSPSAGTVVESTTGSYAYAKGGLKLKPRTSNTVTALYSATTTNSAQRVLWTGIHGRTLHGGSAGTLGADFTSSCGANINFWGYDDVGIQIGRVGGLIPHLDILQGADRFRIQVAGTGYASRPLQIGRDDGLNHITFPGRVGMGAAATTATWLLDVAGAPTADIEVARIYNTDNDTDVDVLELRFGKTGTNPPDACAWIEFTDGDGDRQGKLRADGSGGVELANGFTGHHPAPLVASSATPEGGMIVSSTGIPWAKQPYPISTGIPKVKVAHEDASSKVWGVIAEFAVEDLYEGYVKSWGLEEDEQLCRIANVGEGQILICDVGGELQNGDFVTTSVVTGLGKLQSDDIRRSCTVAKITEDIDWSAVTDTVEHDGNTYKKYLATCLYY